MWTSLTSKQKWTNKVGNKNHKITYLIPSLLIQMRNILTLPAARDTVTQGCMSSNSKSLVKAPFTEFLNTAYTLE